MILCGDGLKEEKRTKKFLFVLANILLPLCIGSGIYLLRDLSIRLPEQIFYYAPDFLWAYGFSFSLNAILRNFNPLLPNGICFLTALCFELLQKTRFPGTFDPLDLVAQACAIGLASFVFTRTGRRFSK